jgi:hypothetical protein
MDLRWMPLLQLGGASSDNRRVGSLAAPRLPAPIMSGGQQIGAIEELSIDGRGYVAALCTFASLPPKGYQLSADGAAEWGGMAMDGDVLVLRGFRLFAAQLLPEDQFIWPAMLAVAAEEGW